MDDTPRPSDRISGAPRTPAALLERSRLLDLLDGPAALVVVKGPAGYGKTALLAQWVRRTQVAGIWLALEPGESDEATFAALLARSLNDAGLVRPGTILSMGEAAIESGEEPWSILRRGFAQLDRDIMLVLDDSHRLSDEVLHRLVRLLSNSPRLRMRVATRRTGVLDSAATALAVDSTVIPASALRMSDEEVAAALQAAGIETDVAEFVRAAGGLPLAVRALLLQADAVGSETSKVGVDRAIDAIESYVALQPHGGETVDPRYTRFLQRTSLAEILTSELAASLSGEDAVRELLDRAESDGLGMWSGDGQQRVFTYTTIVREILRRAIEKAAAEDVRELRTRVARWSVENQRPLTALETSVEIGDFQLASDVVRASWSSFLLAHGREVRRIFTGVPLTALRRYPIITMLLAIVYNAAKLHRVKAVELFALSIMSSRIQRRSASPPDRALLSGMESASLRVLGHFDQALAAAQKTIASLNELSIADRESLGTLVPALYSHAGVSLFYSGREEEALEAFQASVAIGDALSSVSGLGGLSNTAGSLALSGDLIDARTYCDDARRRSWPDGWETGYIASFWQLAEALLALEEGDSAEATRRLRRLDRHRDTIEHWPLLADIEATIAILEGRPVAGLAAFDATVRRHSNRASAAAPITRRVAATRSLLELAAGNASAAEKTLAPHASKDARGDISLARVALVRNEPGVALRRLEWASRHHLSTRMRAEAGVIEAAALSRRGQHTQAMRSLENVCAVLSASGLRLALSLIPERDLEALRHLAQDRPEMLASLRDVAGVIPESATDVVLTERETVVLQALARNGSVSDIAAELFVSPNTVKSQLKGLYRKLGVSTREDAVVAGRALGLAGNAASR